MTVGKIRDDGWAEYDDVDALATELDLSADEVSEAGAATHAYVEAWKLGQVRKAQNRSQREMAAAMGVSQPRVSAIEHGELSKVSLATLQAYVAALGGVVRVVVDLDGKEFNIT